MGALFLISDNEMVCLKTFTIVLYAAPHALMPEFEACTASLDARAFAP
jgi:hypothetical protein